MKFSLIITTYNKKKLLELCLISLSMQKVLPDELIIADDGSKEDFLPLLREMKNLMNIPIKFVTQQDQGFRAARSRNNGVREAKGDFVFFLDQDILISNGFFQVVKENIRKKWFLVGWPIRITENQVSQFTKDIIRNQDYMSIVSGDQLKKFKKQYKKDRIYRILNQWGFRKKGTKFRSGIAGFFKEDFIRINGYDEKYIGWGNEDDDLGRRFYLSGLKGINPFYHEYAVHLWHKEHHNDGERVNLSYHKDKEKELSPENFRCEYGFDKTLGDDPYNVTVI